MILNNYNDYLTYGGNEHEKRISTSLTATLALSMTACGGSKGAGTQKAKRATA